MTNQAFDFKFPKKFFWGASTSAHQIEGGNHNNWTVWELENAKSLAKTSRYKYEHLPIWPEVKQAASTPSNYVSGLAVDHYRRYASDFDIVKKMGLNAFRFSIEWSRIEPEEGVWNPAEIEHYRQYIRALKQRGIEPFATLYHWTVPVWFAKKGAFARAGNVKYFVRFAEKVLEELGADLRYITTINEPDTVAGMGYWTQEHPPAEHSLLKMIWVYRNHLKAHNAIYKMAHRRSRRHKVGFTKGYAYVHAADNRWLSRLAVRFDMLIRDDFVIGYVTRHCDFLGVNYYFTDWYTGLRPSHATGKVSDMGWAMYPQHLEHVLRRLGRKKKPIFVTETGVADRNDAYRNAWLTGTIRSVRTVLDEGVDVRGYMYWSLLDNFEWAYGRWPCFGLIEVEYGNDLKRMPRKSALYYARIVRKARGQ